MQAATWRSNRKNVINTEAEKISIVDKAGRDRRRNLSSPQIAHEKISKKPVRKGG
jgi:hypothetical protein